MWWRIGKIAVEIVCAFVPSRVARRGVRHKMLLWLRAFVYRRCVVPKLKRLKTLRTRIRVGFFVMLDSCFQMEGVYERMLKDPDFDPKIVVIPDVSRGGEYMETTLNKTYRTMKAKYGDRVVCAYEKGSYKDFSADFDIATTMNPYSGMTHKYYTIPYFAKRGVPVFFAKYYFENGDFWGLHFYKLSDLACLWRFYLENEAIGNWAKSNCKFLADNNSVAIVGYPKIDKLKAIKPVSRNRKRIIIAPHHTVGEVAEYKLSNFETYKELFLELPQLYPQIDWVFRPHPLLFHNMVASGLWSKCDGDEYLAKMTSFANVEYQNGGDYFETFVNSDGMIQDCSSFLAEYYYTGHPQCFILRDAEHERKMFPSDWGKSLLENVYKAYTRQSILDFVDNVILAGKDWMRDARLKFYNDNLNCDAASSSESIVRDIKTMLGRTHS